MNFKRKMSNLSNTTNQVMSTAQRATCALGDMSSTKSDTHQAAEKIEQ